MKTLIKASNKKQLLAYKHEGIWQCMDTKRDKEILEKIFKDLSKKLSILIVGATGFRSSLLYFLGKYKYDLTAISKTAILKLKNISHIKLDVSKIKDLKKN